MSRKLKMVPHETDPKCNTSIRASSLTTKYVQAIRQGFVAHMAANPEQATPLFPNDVNSDTTIRLMARIIARDYGIDLEKGGDL